MPNEPYFCISSFMFMSLTRLSAAWHLVVFGQRYRTVQAWNWLQHKGNGFRELCVCFEHLLASARFFHHDGNEMKQSRSETMRCSPLLSAIRTVKRVMKGFGTAETLDITNLKGRFSREIEWLLCCTRLEAAAQKNSPVKPVVSSLWSSLSESVLLYLSPFF